jgi:hypothetical protein
MSADCVVVALLDGLTPEEFVKDNPAWTSTFKFTPSMHPGGFSVKKLLDASGSYIYVGVIAPTQEKYWYACEVSPSTTRDGRHIPAFCPPGQKALPRRTREEAAVDLWRFKTEAEGT